MELQIATLNMQRDLNQQLEDCEGAWDGAVGVSDPCEKCGKTLHDHIKEYDDE